jgi:hypothetical protein
METKLSLTKCRLELLEIERVTEVALCAMHCPLFIVVSGAMSVKCQIIRCDRTYCACRTFIIHLDELGEKLFVL